jgi:hypothetical protein
MEGRVTKYFNDLEVGIIAADDGRKYRFRAAQVMNRHLPIANQEVDFLVASGRPTQIIVLDGTAWTAFGSIEPRQY